jgi:hypothetical protein
MATNRTATQSSADKPKLPVYRGGSEKPERLPGAFELFKPCARAVNDHMVAYLWLAGVPLALFLIGELFGARGFYTGGHVAPVASIDFLGLLVGILVAPSLVMLQLTSVRGEPAEAGDIFQQGLGYVWRLLGLGVVLGVGLLVAFVLLVVPFFILLPRVVLAPYFLVDKDLGVFEALRASNEAYKRWRGTYGVIGVSVLLSLPAIIPIVGTVVSVVLRFLYQPAFAMRYEQLQLLAAGKSPETPVEAALANEQK